ncbi:hypothetical protein I7I53_11649 [Histoplasma capsulatum var. duboisii H88]|uniref:Uncharacterized protein n=1 Tax=Ajellomyces capsulatus (strain H88) TaxID=544711 RepID=A0A8A1LZ72_AJEC8|nr:hypothetical protein I7I53_11649 [Histoplasma capsulatum var. duboisii H88]
MTKQPDLTTPKLYFSYEIIYISTSSLFTLLDDVFNYITLAVAWWCSLLIRIPPWSTYVWPWPRLHFCFSFAACKALFS